MMRSFKTMAVFALSVFVFAPFAAGQEGATELESEEQKASYTIGVQFGKALQYSKDRIDMKVLLEGLEASMAGEDLSMSQAEMDAAIMAFQQLMQQDMTEAMSAQGAAYLEDNAKKDGVVVLPSGLQYRVITKGKGATPTKTDMVSTHYRGTFADGSQFDSSYDRGTPAEFGVTGVIPGWTEALLLMKEGAKWELVIPYDLAYGEAGRQGIPPYSTLVFEIELLDIVKQ